MKIAAQFRYNDKTYVFYLKPNDKSIYYGIKNKNKVEEVKDKSIIQLMDEVLNKSFVSKDYSKHIFIKKKKYNDNEYCLMFDPISSSRYFLPLGQFNLKDLNHLNYVYNDLIMPNNNYNFSNSKQGILRKKVITSLGPIVICIAISFSNLLLMGCAPLHSQEVLKNVSATVPITSTYEKPVIKTSVPKTPYDELMNTINKNKKLTESEKRFIKSVPDLYKDLYYAPNFEHVLNRYKDLDICYEPGNYEAYGLTQNASACYSWSDDRIIVFDADNFNQANRDNLAHELCHVYSGCYNNFGFALYEALNETISNEYFDKQLNVKFSYKKESAILRILFEIFGVDNLVNFYQSGNTDDLIKVLSSLDGDINRAILLVNALDENTLNLADNKERKENIKTVTETLEYYYKLKNKKEFSDDLNMCVNYSVYNPEYTFKHNGQKISEVQMVKKGYICEDYINKYPESVFTYVSYEPKTKIDVSLDEAIELGIAGTYYSDGQLMTWLKNGLICKNGRVTGKTDYINRTETIAENYALKQ